MRHLPPILLTIGVIFVFAFQGCSSSRIEVASTGTDEALEVLKNLKNGEISDMPISGTFVYEREHFAAYSQPVVFDDGRGHIEVELEKKDPGKFLRFVDFAIQGDKIRFSMHEEDENGNVIGQDFVAAWNGQKGVMYKSDLQYANIYTDRNLFSRDYNTSDPTGFSLFDKTIGATVDIEGGEFSIEPAPAEESQIKILVQKSEYRTLKYWLKVGDKGYYIPTKILVYFKDKIESETLIHDYIQTDDGPWFITESTTAFPDRNMEHRFMTKKVEFEAIPDSYFAIELPENTRVDRINARIDI